jgi:uncharacterized protein YdbL (DUF1318 family)
MKVLNIFFGLAITLGFISSNAFAATLPCAVTNVTTLGNNASACINYSGNDGNGSSFITQINADFGTSGNWSQLAKSDTFGSGLTTTTGTSGTWDASSLLSQISNPFVIVLKASNHFSAYLFTSATDGTGTFNTNGVHTNGGGNSGAAGISHMSIYVTDISPVPVPAAAWLMAPVFAGFMLRRRKA